MLFVSAFAEVALLSLSSFCAVVKGKQIVTCPASVFPAHIDLPKEHPEESVFLDFGPFVGWGEASD